MLNKRIGLLALGVLSATQAMANDQADAKGFVEDSHLNVLARNAYISRDYKNHKQDKAEWGQGFLGTFTSGFTQGTVGVGVDAFGIYALRLDGGRGKSGAGGIDFFKQGASGKAADDIAKAGAAVKVRFSNTVLKYGDQMPALPVLMYDNSRLMPESFTGTLLTSKEINGLEINVGRFTAESRKSAEARDSGDLKSINVFGGSYKFTDNLSASLYGSEMEDELNKQYVGVTYAIPLQDKQSLTFDFNGYRTHVKEDYARDVLKVDGQDNKIWSLASTYAFGAHTVTLAYQSSTGEIGYPYGGYRNAGGVGDGGNTILLANSYWSDFNAKDERSWQLGYGFDFGAVGIPGLTYNIAYVRGTNIDDGSDRGRGTEREIFNQAKYVVQSGPVKDLSVRLRGSWLRVSNNASDYNVGGNEVRVFVDYPISIF
ncbi:OprD family porin [Pseudomonas fragi]|uniref:OprD family porin n=1 Tax=Pseudomonas fragi TaxID=296 RepID=UPI0002DF4AB9|nr:OprD family porin [Pseudomonas fragi]MDE4512243.1 OprD family porin [Pseudomonas fragi]QPC36033.1 OprD family porin [Pseudomonas fragi]SDU47702.1 outer membrane porin, OprD family [Pseudomonas fragi]